MQGGEGGGGVDAEFVGEEAAGVGEDGECFGLSAAAVEGEHEEFAQPFAQGVCGGEGGEFQDGFGVVAEVEVEFQARLQEGEVPFLQAGALVVGVGAGEVGQGFAVPQGEGGVQEVAGGVVVSGGAGVLGFGRVPLRVGEVEVERPAAQGAQRVAAGLGDQEVRVRPECFAQA